MLRKRQTRREFIADSSHAALAVSAMAVGLSSCDTADGSEPGGSNGATVKLDAGSSEYEALAAAGGAVKISVQGQSQPVVVVRLSQSEAAAFSSRCPHQGCEVGLPNSNGILGCPCHGATFDQTGGLVQGPAPRSLTSFTATVEGSVITVTT